MGLILSECEPGDFERVFEIVSESFGSGNPYISTVFPAHDTARGRRDGAARLRAEAEANRAFTTFLKVVDPEKDGKIVAMAQWDVHVDHVVDNVPLDGPWWDDGRGDKAMAQELFGQALRPTWDALREEKGNLVSLDLIAVDPTEKRRGAGRMLMNWGVEKADQLGFKMTIEATDEGRLLYESCGLHYVRPIDIVMPEPWTSYPPHQFAWMERDAKS